jgi:hypothetical protein
MFYRYVNNQKILTNDLSDIDIEIESSRIIRIKSHFIHTLGDFSAATSGTNASAAAVGTTGNIGVDDIVGIGGLRTGDVPTGWARFGAPSGSIFRAILLGNHAWKYQSSSVILILSTATNNFWVLDGFFNTTTRTPTAGIFFRYNHANSSGNWECVCVDNNTTTVVDSIVPGDLNWNTRRIEIDKLATTAKFYIDNTLVAEISTNIPKTTGNEVTPQMLLINTAGNSTARGVNVDYMELVGKY